MSSHGPINPHDLVGDTFTDDIAFFSSLEVSGSISIGDGFREKKTRGREGRE